MNKIRDIQNIITDTFQKRSDLNQMLAISFLLIFTFSCKKSSPSDVAIKKEIAIVAKPYIENEFIKQVKVSGIVEAKVFALVSARTPGILETMVVDEGDQVIAKKTRLFSIDCLKLQTEKEIATQQLAVVECSVEERKANQERVTIDYDLAKLNYNRYKKLYENSQAITLDFFEKQQSNFYRTKAVLKHAIILVKLAKTQLHQARSNLTIVKKDLQDATVFSPISGTVISRFMEPGEIAAVGSPIIRIENLNKLEISAFLPGEIYPEVRVGSTSIKVVVNGINLGEQLVSFKSSGLDPKLRTFKIKCEITNPPAGVVPGGMAKVAVILKKRKGIAVINDAILIRDGEKIVFIVDGEKVKKVSVKTGLTTGGLTELLDCALKPTDKIVIMGQTMIEDGSHIKLMEDGR